MVPLALNEVERLAALRDLGVVGSPPEPHYDAVCRTAQALFGAPIALVSLVCETEQWFKAACGLEIRGTSREVSFCTHAILTDDVLVIEDTTLDARFVANSLVTGEPHVRFYAGAPLILSPGIHVGSLCVIDRVPRTFSAAQREQLRDLAQVVVAHLRLDRAERAMRESLAGFRLLTETTTDIVVSFDLDGTRRYISPAIKAVLGYEPESLHGSDLLAYTHPDDRESVRQLLSDLVRGRTERAVNQHRLRHANGSWVWIEASFGITRDPQTHRPNGSVASIRDISERKRIEMALRLSEERFALAIESGSDGLWDWKIPTDELDLSPHWFTMLGYDEGDTRPGIHRWREMIHPDDIEGAYRLLILHFKGKTESYECEYRLRTKEGAYRWMLARGKVVARDAQARALRMVGTHSDITRRKEAEHQIAHMALHDGLTGLPNRTLFRDRLNQEMRHSERHGYSFAILACDLDRFKVVNDTLGHPAGDALLRTVAERLKAVVREGDTVARLGGDEFAIILGRLDQPQDASVVAQAVIDAVGEPVDLDGHLMSVGVSLGIAIGPMDHVDADDLFKNADIALYRAKGTGRNTYRFYEAGMDASIAQRNLLEQDLRQAAKQGGFALHYQPTIKLRTGQIDGFEALMRWHHPVRGTISPAEFIPMAEETGLIVALGEWALREACREAAGWPEPLRIAVNVSAVQFQHPGLEQAVMAALAASGLSPTRLELEITESVLVQDAEAVLASLHRLTALGVRIALDDFGTGYSSLSYLRRFPFDRIKIDRSFIREISDPDAAAIVRAVVGLATDLGASITAEGVETEDQLERVRQAGCTDVQGYLYSKPLPAADAAGFIRGRAMKNAA